MAGNMGANPCPPWYADANVVLSWDGDYTGNNMTACKNDGTTVNFTLVNATVDSVGEGGSNALVTDADTEYMRYTVGTQFIDFTADQTICMKIKVYGPLDNYCYIQYAFDAAANDKLSTFISVNGSDNRIVQNWDTQADANVSDIGDIVANESFTTVAMTWDESAESHGPNPGDGAPTWADGWELDADTINAMTDNAYYIDFGMNPACGSGGPGAGHSIVIDSIAIVNAFQFDCSTLTGW